MEITQKAKALKTKHLILISVIATFFFSVSVSGLVWGPDKRETQFIELGMLKEEQVNEHEQADLKREEIDKLGEGIIQHQRNYDKLQGEIEALEQSLFTENLSQSSKTGLLALEGVKFTSYNPEAGQTDGTPCIAGGTGFDLCEMAQNGQRPIAFSQELIQWSMYGKNGPFEAGDIVRLESTDFPDDARCNGEFIVSDAMNARFTHRGDLFFMTRAENTSCTANVYLVQ